MWNPYSSSWYILQSKILLPIHGIQNTQHLNNSLQFEYPKGKVRKEYVIEKKKNNDCQVERNDRPNSYNPWKPDL